MNIVEKWNMPLVHAARATWPDSDWSHWHKYNDAQSVKLATKDALRMTAPVQELIRQMVCLPMPDGWFPDLDLHGAGMHWIPEGGHLRRHLDGQVHPLKQWYRKANTILFLDSCAGGELLIEDSEVICPAPGLLVTFNADKWHEVLPVINGQRRSVSLFWWSLDGSGERDRAFFSEDSGSNSGSSQRLNVPQHETFTRSQSH